MASQPFRVVLTGRSALKAGAQRVWEDPERRLNIRDDLLSGEPNTPTRHVGLIYTVDLRAEHIIDAIHGATSYARYVTDQLAGLHGAMIDHAVPQFSIGIAPESGRRDFAQVFYNVPIIHEPRRNYDHALYSHVFARLNQFRKADPDQAQRIDRAFHYLRNSYSEQDPVDRFEDAWVALEAITPILCKKYKKTGLRSIEHIITHLLGESRSNARAVHDQRNDIVHARAKLAKVLKDIVPNTRFAQRAAIAGILDFLDVPQELRTIAVRDFLPIAGPPRIIVQCALYDFAIEQLPAHSKYPQLHLHFVERLVPTDAETHAGEARPLAVQLLVGMTEYAGHWELGPISSVIDADPTQGAHAIEIIATKFPSRKDDATASAALHKGHDHPSDAG